MYSSIYSLQSSTQRLPIRALFGFTLKLVESYSSLSSQESCMWWFVLDSLPWVTSASDRMGCACDGLPSVDSKGFQWRRWSLARQWGWRGEREGVRPGQYGRGFEDDWAGGSVGGRTNLGEWLCDLGSADHSGVSLLWVVFRSPVQSSLFIFFGETETGLVFCSPRTSLNQSRLVFQKTSLNQSGPVWTGKDWLHSG